MIILESTNRCTRDCPVCGAAKGQAHMKRQRMPWETFEHLARQAAELKAQVVCLHAHGEPLLHPRIIDMVRFLKELGLSAHITTNGDPLTPELSAQLAEAGLDELVISHPALSPANFKAGMGRDWEPDLDERLEACLNAWPQGKGRLVMRCMIMNVKDGRSPVSQLAAYLEKWLPNPALSSLEFHAYQPWPKLVLEKHLRFMGSKPRICTMVHESLSVLSSGRITPCSYDVDAELSLGHCDDMSLKRAYNHPRLRRHRLADIWRKNKRPRLCRSCLVPRAMAPAVAITAEQAGVGRDEAWREKTARRVLRYIYAAPRTAKRKNKH